MIKTIGIMQPYFLPYIGYFQLINLVDEFVIYDRIEFTKKGWINRNRMLQNDKDEFFTIPLKKDSDYLYINQRFLSDNSQVEKSKILRKIEANYRKSPQFSTVFPIIEKIFQSSHNNLFDFIFHSICEINAYLDITTKIIKSSELPQNIETFKAQEKVIEICKNLNANKYINAIGGVDLYKKEDFEKEGFQLNFIKTSIINYTQFNKEFVPWLSIVDVMMFNNQSRVKEYLLEYTLI